MSMPEAAQQPATPLPPSATPPPSAPAPSSALSVVALVIGIIAFVSGLAPFWGIIAGAAAIVFGVLALKKQQNKGLALTGLILGAVAALTSLVTTIALVAGVGAITANRSPDAKPPAATTASEEPVESEAPAPEPEPNPVFETLTYSGSGDFVQPVGNLTDVLVVTFTCADCSRNTVLKSNGRESLLVNTIGAYSGSHWINLSDGSMTTEFEINSTGNWTLTIADPSTAAAFDGAASGTGDAAIILRAKSTTAAITNDGSGNFVVKGYGASFAELAVNTIGAYSGTVKLTMPAVVQVNSEGNWTITPQ